uniref:SLC41A/MgtE integral membrane domain-containing protein n=1 Tax=Parascaris univalens TaxID=6257 RepID=A0A915AFK2_PARUN
MLPTCTEQQCLFSLAIAVGIILVTPMLSYFAISTENTKGVLLYGWWSIVAGALIGWYFYKLRTTFTNRFYLSKLFLCKWTQYLRPSQFGSDKIEC